MTLLRSPCRLAAAGASSQWSCRSSAVLRSRIIPAPTVTLVTRSMTMNAPVAAVAAVAVEADRLVERDRGSGRFR